MQFERLFNAITDVDLNLKLGLSNLLIKDFKTYFLLNEGLFGIGVGTIHVPLDLMIESFSLNGIKEAISALIEERPSLAFYAILTNCRNRETGKYNKEIFLYRPPHSKVNDYF